MCSDYFMLIARDNGVEKKLVFLPLPPGEAAAKRRVRERGVIVTTGPSSPALLRHETRWDLNYLKIA